MTDADLIAANAAARELRDAIAFQEHLKVSHSWDEIDEAELERDIAAMLDHLDRAMAAVMATGRPGGHASQHDPGCHLAGCQCGPGYQTCDGWQCYRLPGCRWPDEAGAAPVPSTAEGAA